MKLELTEKLHDGWKKHKTMNFTDFIIQNHPDPDSLFNEKYDQLCKLAEDYAESKQLLQSRVVWRSEQLCDKLAHNFCIELTGKCNNCNSNKQIK